MNAASVKLKRRIEKLAPKRKLERLKRNVLPPQCVRRRVGTLPAAASLEGSDDWSATRATVVDGMTVCADSCVICFFSSHVGSIQPFYAAIILKENSLI